MHQDARGYWYRSKRESGRVVREYIGRGEWCASLATLEDLDARRAGDERRRQREARARLEAQVLAVEAAGGLAGAVWTVAEGAARAALEGAGYHLHARGQWRKRRASPPGRRGDMGTSGAPSGKAMAKKSVAAKSLAVPVAQMEHGPLLKAANEGDVEAVREVFSRLDGTPELAVLVDMMADLALRAQENILGVVGGRKSPLSSACFERKLLAMKAELGGPSPAPVERLLVERIVNCWLQVHQLEIMLNHKDLKSCGASQYLDKRLDRAHARYLAAIRSLGQVRRLARPMPPPLVQVNVSAPQAPQEVARRTFEAGAA